MVDPEQRGRQRREQRPRDDRQQAPAQRSRGQAQARGRPRCQQEAAAGGQEEWPDPAPAAAEPVGGGDRGLEQAFVQVAHPGHRLVLVADQRVRDGGDHGRRDRDRRERDRGSGEALQRERDREGEEGEQRVEEARAHEAAPEGQVVTRVVEQEAQADAADRERLGAPAAPVEHHRADRPHDQHGGDGQEAPRVEQQRRQHPQARCADPEEAFVLAGHVGVGEVRPGVKGVVVVEQQRHDPDDAAGEVGAATPQDSPRREGVPAREQQQAEHDRGEERRVLRRECVAHRQAGERQQHRAGRTVALAQHHPEGGEAEEGGERVREQQLRERQHHRAQAEHDRRRHAIAGLVALGDAPHEQHQQQARQHAAPQADQVDHLVARVVRRRHMRVCPGFGVHEVQRVVEREREQSQPGRPRGVVVPLVVDLVARVRLIWVDRRAVVVERADQVVVGGLVPGEALDHHRGGQAHQQDRRQRQPGARQSRAARPGGSAGAAIGDGGGRARGSSRGGAHQSVPCRALGPGPIS